MNNLFQKYKLNRIQFTTKSQTRIRLIRFTHVSYLTSPPPYFINEPMKHRSSEDMNESVDNHYDFKF